VNLDLSDDEELANAMDYHSMIINSHHHTDEDHVVTADEVISELEMMMEVCCREIPRSLKKLIC
jgi:hypothetical protein